MSHKTEELLKEIKGLQSVGLCPISPNPALLNPASPNPNSRKPMSFAYFPKEEMPMTSNQTDLNRNTNPNRHSNGNIFMRISLTPIKKLYHINERN